MPTPFLVTRQACNERLQLRATPLGGASRNGPARYKNVVRALTPILLPPRPRVPRSTQTQTVALVANTETRIAS